MRYHRLLWARNFHWGRRRGPREGGDNLYSSPGKGFKLHQLTKDGLGEVCSCESPVLSEHFPCLRFYNVLPEINKFLLSYLIGFGGRVDVVVVVSIIIRQWSPFQTS